MSVDPNTEVRGLPDDPALPGLEAIRAANLEGALPHDPDLPGLVAIRASGLTGALPELGPRDGRFEIEVRAYKPGRRITLEMRTGDRRLAIKAYDKSPAEEVALTQAFAAAGLTRDTGARVPPILIWRRDLRVLAIGWLEGPTASDLMKLGQGERVGELAARWLELAATLPFDLGPPRDSAWMLRRASKWVDRMRKADAGLGDAAADIADRLKRTVPRDAVRCLAHGTFHDRNVIDCGDGPGVIDWEFAGMGPPELDAGSFLACLSWRSVREERSGAAIQAKEAFLSQIAGSVDPRALGWHQAAGLLCRAARTTKRHMEDGQSRADALLEMARRAAEGEVA